ncbi:MAG: DUF58 domain-containing protein [Candidatus Electryoneaceae bacterium]|nr:DUF58 domain-containing protein [Candidatus Electryoneaceae bacterium]
MKLHPTASSATSSTTLKSPNVMRNSDPTESSKSPISRELLRKVKLLELRTRLQVHDMFGGRYKSVFKGEGMDFDEVREYIPGDDVRNIDWNVTARMNAPYVKIFREERELTVMLLVDLSASSEFGTASSLKREVAAELTALLALCAKTNNDKVGLLLFTDEVEHFVVPKKEQQHILRIIRDVLAFKPHSKKTSITNALEYALRVLRKRSVVFLLSDFMDDGYQKAVRIMGRKHDFIAVELYDPRELVIPSVGLMPFRDPETDDITWVDTSSRMFRSEFEREANRRFEERNNFFKSINVDRIVLPVDQPYLPQLVRFFKMRERRR